MLQKHLTMLKYSRERRICGLRSVINRICVRKFSSYEKQDIMVIFTMIKEEQGKTRLSLFRKTYIYQCINMYLYMHSYINMYYIYAPETHKHTSLMS